MKPTWCYLKDQDYMMKVITLEAGLTVCNQCDRNCVRYSSFHRDQCICIPSLMEELPLVEDKALPRTPMYCRECNKTTGKFVAKVKNRNKEQYVIQCSSCGQRWLINVSDYRRQNAGFVNMNGDYIPPSRNGQIPKHLQLQKDKRMKEFREQLGLPQPNNEPEFIWGGPKRGLIPNPKFQNNLK